MSEPEALKPPDLANLPSTLEVYEGLDGYDGSSAEEDLTDSFEEETKHIDIAPVRKKEYVCMDKVISMLGEKESDQVIIYCKLASVFATDLPGSYEKYVEEIIGHGSSDMKKIVVNHMVAALCANLDDKNKLKLMATLQKQMNKRKLWNKAGPWHKYLRTIKRGKYGRWGGLLPQYDPKIQRKELGE